MTISAYLNFDSEIPWANGSGCFVCRSNVSEEGAKIGVQCVDLGVVDDFLGRYGLCYDCAAQVALVIGFVSKDSMLEILDSAGARAAEAAESKEAALAASAQARLDKDTVARLLGSVYDRDLVDA